jgi:hypothetical protein
MADQKKREEGILWPQCVYFQVWIRREGREDYLNWSSGSPESTIEYILRLKGNSSKLNSDYYTQIFLNYPLSHIKTGKVLYTLTLNEFLNEFGKDFPVSKHKARNHD